MIKKLYSFNNKRMIQKRIEIGLTFKELSERTGLTEVALWKMENAKTVPNPKTINKVAKALGIRPDDLVSYNGNQHK